MPSLPRPARPATAALILAVGTLVLVSAAQTLSPGEVRLSSHPYVLGATLLTESRLVQLEIVVRDARGRAVTGLTKNNFVVYDSGKNRNLTTFSVDTLKEVVDTNQSFTRPGRETIAETRPPALQSPGRSLVSDRWIALVFDDINTSAGDLAHAKIAASRFIKEAVRSGDSIALFTTSGSDVSGFTSDSTAILVAMTKVQSRPRMSPGGLAQCPRMTAYEAYQIVNKNPAAMKAKVSEACACGGSSGCNVEGMRDTDLLNPTPNSGNTADPYGGAGTVSSLIDSILAQAQQTWDQAHLASQVTLDAIKGSVDQLARRPGRRMLLLASSGFLSGMLEEEKDSIINAALRNSVVINSLDAKGLYAEAPGTPLDESVESVEIPVSTSVFQMRSLGDRLDDLDSAMARFAESTGGLLFRNNNDLDLGFRQLGLLPNCTYLLGFPPAEDGKYHKIKVELKNASHDFVQVRPGYFAPAAGDGQHHMASDKLDDVMRGTEEKADFPVVVTQQVGTLASGERQLTIQTHIDIQKLSFEQQKDRHVQRLTFVAAIFDSQGSFVTGKEAMMELALKPESFEHLSRTGINGVMQLEMPPGSYRLRMVLQEALHGNMNATSKELQIR